MFPIPARAPADRTMPLVAATASAIVLLSLVAAILFWLALVDHAPARGGQAIGAALTPARGALVVDGLRRGGAAMRAGLRVGDLVEAVDGVPVGTVGEAERLSGTREVDLRVRRGDRDLTLHLLPERRPPLG